MRHRFLTADVFTDRIFGGNPLAVFPDARGLDTEQMQQVARELNLSETVFVFPPEDPAHTRKLRIFTPGMEMPFAGHPTVGAAHVLARIGEVRLGEGLTRVVFEEGVGPVPVEIEGRAGEPVFARLTAAALPEHRAVDLTRADLAALLGIGEGDLAEGCEAISCGMPFLFVPLVSRDALARVALDRGCWRASVAGAWAQHVYAFVVEAAASGPRVRARMFAPALRIEEDPATGAAATALAGWLAPRFASADGTLDCVVEQGVEMGRASTLHLEVDVAAGRVTSIRVGGGCVLVSDGTMKIP